MEQNLPVAGLSRVKRIEASSYSNTRRDRLSVSKDMREELSKVNSDSDVSCPGSICTVLFSEEYKYSVSTAQYCKTW